MEIPIHISLPIIILLLLLPPTQLKNGITVLLAVALEDVNTVEDLGETNIPGTKDVEFAVVLANVPDVMEEVAIKYRMCAFTSNIS